MNDEVRVVDGVVHICLRPSMYVKHGTVAEIVAWLDYDASPSKKCGIRSVPRNWPQFRKECLAEADLLAMTPQDLMDRWNEWKACDGQESCGT